ncbi:MAG: LPXTG cell wall anchor domain-containing protein [Oscillospiraceae bacterium]|nr:LPXTG cell wall anchor domain-containing protein [Oscillospiraceae bacterium]
MKRVISLVLCLMLVLGLAATASAATVVNNVDGHNFEIYQVFSGTQSGTDANLGNIVWGTGVNGSTLLTDLKNLNATKAYFESILDNEFAAENVASVLAHKDTPVDVINQFAQLAYNNRTNTKQAISAGEYEDVPAGYYMIVDVTALEDGDAYNPALLQVTNAGDITISKKYDVPEHDKSVIADDNGDHGGHVDMEDSPIGKPVEFHLKAEMPLNMTGFEKYTMTFHDDLSKGLTLQPETIELWVGGTKVEDTTKYSVKVNSTETPLVCDKDGGSYACDFHVVVPDVMAIDGYAPGCEVIVKYKAILNEDAVINENGNPNDYRLEYSNDPNWDPDDPTQPEPPTGVTPWNEVKVYTTEVEIKKVDGTTDLPLTGAEFTLVGETANVVKVTKNKFVPYTEEDETNGETKYWELKDGTYTTTNPATPDLDTTNYVNTSVVYSNKITTEFVGAGKEQTEIKASVGNDGIVKFAGLGEGTYTVTETDVPDGYNGLKSPMTLTIVFHEAEERWEYSWTGGATGSGASIQVDNMKGSVLPETGGIGTTIFYVIGGLLFASSAVLLITKKRMTAE